MPTSNPITFRVTLPGWASTREVEPREWQDLALRLLGASHLGIHIQSENGHRYVALTEGVENAPSELFVTLFGYEAVTNSGETGYLKHYGSVSSALDLVDAALTKLDWPTLKQTAESAFFQYDPFDASTVFGLGLQ